MKRIILTALSTLSVTSAFAGPGACLDKIAEQAGAAVLAKTVDGQQVARFGIKKIEADLWMVNPTYHVVVVGTNALGADVLKFEKDFIFAAQPTENCHFELIEVTK